MILLIEGSDDALQEALAWASGQGVQVEPIGAEEK
jgi:hypothetical protein